MKPQPRQSRDERRPTEYEDERGVFYAGGQRYHYEWCHTCGGGGCDYCEGVGQIRVDEIMREGSSGWKSYR